MADARRSRYALVAARTRKRNEIVRGGAAPRKTSAKRESERIESGRRTVSEAFGGVPNKTAFLKRAHLFERKKNAKAVDRAYIFPEGEEDLRRLAEEKLITLYWYRRDLTTAVPPYDETVIARDSEGGAYRLTCAQNITAAPEGIVDGKRLRRTCTGEALFLVKKAE